MSLCVWLHARKDAEASRKESFAEASWKLKTNTVYLLFLYIYIYFLFYIDYLEIDSRTNMIAMFIRHVFVIIVHSP